MTHPNALIAAIVASSPECRVGVLEAFGAKASLEDLVRVARTLHDFAMDERGNVYQRVRATLQAHAIYRYLLADHPRVRRGGHIPHHGRELLLARHYRAAADTFQQAAQTEGLSGALASALAAAYHEMGFQLLAAQVQRSVRSLRGNRWMFRTGHGEEHPLRIREELTTPCASGTHPILVERTPVRMDLTHSGWSDIFFLGMDYPEGARVLNVSVDLAVLGRDRDTRPPITCFFRVVREPVLRLVSVDLDAVADLTETAEVFDYASDYLGLLKAAVVASGIVPPALEGSGQSLAPVLERLVGPGLGIELVSQVNDIPKGSRLAVSTNLLVGLIAICMRATRQVATISGPLSESERQVVAGRAILGEWLGGSGGGWQDSAGAWPGIKLIEGVAAGPDDIEWGLSRGRLLPRHTLLGSDVVSPEARQQLEDSLIVVHGGMAANVGPILEMVTEKFLLGTRREWDARQELLAQADRVLDALRRGNLRELGRITTSMFRGPLATIIPWVSNYYTEQLIADAEREFGDRFWGFCMLGGMSGGGMAFIVDPSIKTAAESRLVQIMQERKEELDARLPFAMDPIAYRFSVNERGSWAELVDLDSPALSAQYYLCMLPRWLRTGSQSFTTGRRDELEGFSLEHLHGPEAATWAKELVRRLLPAAGARLAGESLNSLLERHGFDSDQHEHMRRDLLAGRIGLAKNRLPVDVQIEDVAASDVVDTRRIGADAANVGIDLLKSGSAAIVTLAAGVGSRWTQGAGTVKAVCPFARLGGRFRSFLEIHLAKSLRAQERWMATPPHLVTTSHLTHEPIARWLEQRHNAGLGPSVILSPGRSIGLRLVPTTRDLRFAWEQMKEQQLEERKQKVRDSARKALLEWAQQAGEASDYRDNLPLQCLHPVGHWYEVANLLLNGTLRRLVDERPQLSHLMLHNIDTLGADLDPGLLGQHVASKACLSFEVIERRLDDRGGGLARVDGRVRLIEGLAFPREEDESRLTYYNTLTTWISIDPLLEVFDLSRADLTSDERVRRGVRNLAARLPTYITVKDVKRRWGNAQEDVFPVSQFEKLWGDMSALPDVSAQYFVVPRHRGQQLKDTAQLDSWVRDGSRDHVESLCSFQ